MTSIFKITLLTTFLSFILSDALSAQKLIPVAEGWAGNSVNAVIFRRNSLVTHGKTQFVAFYDQEGRVVLGKRKLNSKKWELHTTQYRGNIRDAHNSISIMVDGDGYLHMSWDHHGHPLRYARSVEPLSLQMSDKMSMTGTLENNVTYPEFFLMPDGGLIFMYRDGQSGRGNLALNRYDLKTKTWTQLHGNLIDGERRRNAYWQACVDSQGVIHLSWVWRSTWDVSTNHDMAYARSMDGGVTWQKSNGEMYDMPIRAANSEYAWRVPQNSELINQTSMTTDRDGNPYIATYWRDQDSQVPQFRIIHLLDGKWNAMDLAFRNTPFSLSGGGTKSIPISRPQILVEGKGKRAVVRLVFRDEERGSRVSVATCRNLSKPSWKVEDLTNFSVGAWEPSFDTELWRKRRRMHLFVQSVIQIDGEGVAQTDPEMVYVLEGK